MATFQTSTLSQDSHRRLHTKLSRFCRDVCQMTASSGCIHSIMGGSFVLFSPGGGGGSDLSRVLLPYTNASVHGASRLPDFMTRSTPRTFPAYLYHSSAWLRPRVQMHYTHYIIISAFVLIRGGSRIRDFDVKSRRSRGSGR